MPRQIQISSDDMKAMLATAAELQALGGMPARRTGQLLTRLNSLVGGHVAVGGVVRRSRGTVVPVALQQVGFTGRPPAEFERYLQQLVPPNPAVAPLLARLARQGRLATELRKTLVPDRVWNASEHVRRVRVPAGLGDAIFSASRVRDSDLVTVLSINRPAGDRARFTERERTLVHLLHAHAAPFLRDVSQGISIDDKTLTPRQKLTLEYLLKGDSEKEIAARVGRSHHTVHVHVKGIYKAFEVTTRAELLSKFVHTGRARQ